KKPGDAVQKGEFLLIVQTDKVDIEIEAPCSGTLAQVTVELGQFVPVGSLIGRIAQAGESSELPRETIETIPAPAQKQPIASTAPALMTKAASSPDSDGHIPLSQR